MREAIRLGVAFDLLWDLEGLELSDYREVVRIREDGKVEVHEDNEMALHDGARIPTRPTGTPPTLTLDVSIPQTDASFEVRACATVTKSSAAVY